VEFKRWLVYVTKVLFFDSLQNTGLHHKNDDIHLFLPNAVLDVPVRFYKVVVEYLSFILNITISKEWLCTCCHKMLREKIMKIIWHKGNLDKICMFLSTRFCFHHAF